MTKNYTDKIAEARQKIEQEQNKVKRLLQEQKAAERKARTKRLIERGAILEHLIEGAEAMTNEDMIAYLRKVLPPIPVTQILDPAADPSDTGDSLV